MALVELLAGELPTTMTGALVMVILHFARLPSIVQVLTIAAKAYAKFAESCAGSHATNAFHLMHI